MFFLEKNLCHFAVFEKNLEKKLKLNFFWLLAHYVKMATKRPTSIIFELGSTSSISGFLSRKNSEVDVALQSHPAFRYIKKCDSIFKN